MPAEEPASSAVPERLRQQLVDLGYQLLGAPAAAADGSVQVSAGRLHAFQTPGHGLLHVLVPVSLQVRLGPDGTLLSLSGGEPDADDLLSARTSLEDLIADGRLDDPGSGTPARAATHGVVTQSDGKRVVRRKGFDASGLDSGG